MNTTDSPTPAQRLEQRRRRVRSIRRRVAGLAAGTFLAATGGILVQLVTGHDPALADGGSTAAATTTATASTGDTSRSTAPKTTAGSSARRTSTAVASAPSPITTSTS